MANEKRVRVGRAVGTIDNSPLAVGGTTIDFGSDPGFDTLASDEHLALVLDPEESGGALEIVYLTAYTATGTTGTIARGQEGTTAREHANGTVWRHGPTLRDFAAGRVAWAERTAGDVTISSTSPAVVDASLDLTVPAYPGDVIVVGVHGFCNDTVAQAIRTDFRMRVDGSDGNFVSSGTGTARTGGTAGGNVLSSEKMTLSSNFMYRLQAGDIHDGTVTVRLNSWVSGSSRVLFAQAGFPLRVQLQNLGPQEA